MLLVVVNDDKKYGDIQIEVALDGSYIDGEVDADINNMCIGGVMSILPRDRSVPFSPPHKLRHIVNKKYAYVRQPRVKIGVAGL